MSLSAAQRRKLRRAIESSSNRCADCRQPVRYWLLVSGIPTCNVCGSTTPLGGQIQRPRYSEDREG